MENVASRFCYVLLAISFVRYWRLALPRLCGSLNGGCKFARTISSAFQHNSIRSMSNDEGRWLTRYE